MEDLYDELTTRRIDGSVRKERRAVGSGRRTLGGGALFTAVALGLQEALEPRQPPPIIEEFEEADHDAQAVSLYLVRGFPGRSRALVRPWLLT